MGPGRRRDPQRHRRRRLAGPGRQGLQDRAALRPGAADIGWARAPLGDLHDTHAAAALGKTGVRVALRTRAAAVTRDDAGWQVAVENSPHGRETLTADTVVLAVPQREAHALLPDGALPAKERLLEIGTAPILNVHVIYDRKVVRRPFFAAIGSPVQWVFDRTEASGLARTAGHERSQYLALSQSAAQAEIDQPVAALAPATSRVGAAAAGRPGRRILDFFVTREAHRDLRARTGRRPAPPAARTQVPGLYLAGAWTATGWPATMESAVRSGTAAAREALTELGVPQGQLPQEAA
ncbi:FAD-dependent oxidoreductase [Streptomyces albulus]|nr:FAD-dependent oxidoreductase [Streptomyces noursei]